MGSIYKITNSVNGKVYIGQTVLNPQNRWKNHKNCAKSGIGNQRYKCPKLYNAINKYGDEKFRFELISLEIENQLLDFWERLYICLFNSVANGYNILSGGQKTSTLGYKFSDEQKKKMSESRQGKDNGNFGKRWSKEQRDVMSKKKQGLLVGKEFNWKHPNEYQFTDITGIRYTTTNLLKFCKDFDLDRRAMKRVITGEYSNHHGFNFIQKKRL